MRLLRLAVLLLLAACAEPVKLPTYWAVPEFTLTERSGETFKSAQLKGKVWVADFFFATCPGVCPLLSARMAAVKLQLAKEDGVRYVSITTDPGSDTPAVLRDYAKRFRADEHWYFLTGDKAYIWKLCQDGFKLPVADSPGGPEPITHSSRLVLVDKAGNVRGTYEGVGEEGPERIVADIKKLLAE